ncbi:MAG TPA: SulP family inorganic anion transporter, partial [Burkholderiaceae bacterium]|nr:SulP family inorganic anion transporter [Burkholderiaceae bacterium]
MAFPFRANPPSWFAPWRQDRPADARLLDDVVAAVIVTLLLIPQSLAYAVLAGVPAHLGLYASIFPLLAYAAFGRSPVLAVGPVALTSIMTLDALQGYAVPGSPEWIAAATFLALASGALLFAMGALRLGFLAQLLSHPVMSGFVSGTAILIVLGQLKTLTGIPVQGKTAPDLIQSFFQGLGQFESVTIVTGVTSLLLIALGRRFIRPWLSRQPIPTTTAELLGRAVPLVVVALATVVLMVSGMALETRTVGTIPSGLPSIGLPALDIQGLQGLLLS